MTRRGDEPRILRGTERVRVPRRADAMRQWQERLGPPDPVAAAALERWRRSRGW